MISLVRHKRRWEDNIKVGLKQIWRVAVYCNNIVQKGTSGGLLRIEQ